MSQTVVPMIHVADVSATVNWYSSIGFKVVGQNENEDCLNCQKPDTRNPKVRAEATRSAALQRLHDFPDGSSCAPGL